LAEPRIDEMGWRGKLDYLELHGDVGLMPVLASLRVDMELMAVCASRFAESEALLADLRRDILDLIAIRQEHRAEV
jgi:hypothetical protein